MTTDTITDWPAELERMAREAEKEALAAADEWFDKCAAEHERQTAGFSFECKRHGDFLTVFMERSANEPTWAGDKALRKVSTSLNIGEAKEIRLVEGHCFDRRGKVVYRASMVADAGTGCGWGSGSGRSKPPKGYHYEVFPDYPHVPRQRPMVEIEKKDRDRHRGIMMGMDDYQPRHVTEQYPRAAKDDEIRFKGIGATIYAPAGKGSAVYDTIMEEIAKGWEPPAIVDTHPKGGDA